MSIKGLTLGIPVSNLEESSKWYRLLLGEPEEFSPAAGTREFLLAKGSWLQLIETENVVVSDNILRLEVEDINATHKHVGAINAEPGEIVHIPELITLFEFRDVDGNNLSFYELESDAS